MAALVRRCLNRLIPPVKNSHHNTDPQNTPITSQIGACRLLFSRPMPENNARNERIVTGLDRVNRNVEK